MTARRERRSCRICGREGMISTALGVCTRCILENYIAAEPFVLQAQARARARFDLPARPPSEGVQCTQCVNMCRLREGGMGYCGIRTARGGVVRQVVDGAVLKWYYDPLPTNCVADFVCPGGTGCGHPKYARRKGPEFGYKNLAIFYGACNFSCLYCQNWHFRRLTQARSPVMRAEKLASKADDKTTCICFFGGDPTPQVEHAIETSRIARDGRDLMRICFETNGSVNRKHLREMADLAYESGGCIKIDMKAYHGNLNKALSGADNRWTLNNVRWLADYEGSRKGRGIPFLVASTLLVPGYVEKDEVSEIARFIADLNANIPYSLLAFSPQFEMMDLPRTSAEAASECLAAAREAGLKKVRLGNVHLVE